MCYRFWLLMQSFSEARLSSLFTPEFTCLTKQPIFIQRYSGYHCTLNYNRLHKHQSFCSTFITTFFALLKFQVLWFYDFLGLVT